MAATSDLERLQCIALAVRAATIPEGRLLPTVGSGKAVPTIKPPAGGQTPETVLYVARKPMTPEILRRCWEVHATATEGTNEVFFYELFNFYSLARPMSFWASPARDRVVNLPQHTRLTRALLEYLPKEYFAAGTKTTAELGARRQRLLEKIAKLEAKVVTERSYLEMGEKDHEGIVELLADIAQRKAEAATLQHQIDTFTGFFRRASIKQPLKEVCGPFLDRAFQYGTVSHPVSPFALALSGTGAAFTIPPTLLKVWKVTKNCDTLLAGRRLADYRFMDQNSRFMRTVKDEALLSLIDNFGLRGTFNPQILSPVDIFIVRHDRMEAIKTRLHQSLGQYVSPKKGGATAKQRWRERKALFRKLRTDSPTTPTSYGRLMRTVFEDRTCLGISLKLPEKVGGDPVMKIVGEATIPDLAPSVFETVQDSFTKFLVELDKNPTAMNAMIDKLVEIEYQEFDIRRNIRSWTYPVRFHYDAIFPGLAKTLGRTTLDVRFNLMTWDKAGFNGQWSIHQPDATYTPPSNWTGGFAMKPANVLFQQYTGYNTLILPRMVALRTRAFHTVVRNLIASYKRGVPAFADHARKATGESPLEDWSNVQALRSIPNFSTYYKEAIRQIKKPQIIGSLSEEDSMPILRFFRLLDGEEMRLAERTYKDAQRDLAQAVAKKQALPSLPKSAPAHQRQDHARTKEALQREIQTRERAVSDAKKERDAISKRTNVTKHALQYYEIYRATAVDYLLADMKAHRSKNAWAEYVRTYWSLSLEERGGKGTSFIPNIAAHYVAAQFAFFLFYGGEDARLQLKRKIFLSVFGLITKSGYKTFETFTVNNVTMIEDIFQARVEMIEGSGKKAVSRTEVFRFVQAPYVIFS